MTTTLTTDQLTQLLPGSTPSPILRQLEASYAARRRAAQAVAVIANTEDNIEVRSAMQEVADELTTVADAAYDAFVSELGGDVMGWVHDAATG